MANLSVTLLVVDKATAPIRAFASRLNGITASFRKIKNGLKLTSSELGIPQVGKAFSAVGSAAGNVARQVKNLAKEFAIAGGLAAGFLGGIVYSTANAGDAVYKTAQKVGVTTEAWGKLAYAADMSGVSAEQLQKGMTRLGNSAINAARGNKEAQFWFDRLGVSITDQNGKIKTNDALLAEMADKFAAMPDGMQKTGIAAKIFGNGVGPQLVPLLNAGKAGLADLGAEAERLGLLFSNEEAKAAESFNDSLARVGKAVSGVTYAIGNQLIPVFEPLLNWLEDLIVANRELVASKVTEWIGVVQAAIPDLRAGLESVWAGVSGFAADVDTLVQGLGGWKEVLPYIAGGLAALKLAPLIFSVLSLVKAVAALGVTLLTTPIGWIALGIAALVAGFTYLWRNCEGFRAFWIGLWEGIKTVLSGVLDFFGGIFGRIGAAFKGGFINGILAVLIEFHPLTLFVRAFDAVIEYLTGGSLIGAVTNAGRGILNGLWSGIKDVWNQIEEWFGGLSEKIAGLIPESVTGFISSVGSLAGGAVNAVSGVASSVSGAVSGLASSSWNAVSGLFGGAAAPVSEEQFAPPVGVQSMLREQAPSPHQSPTEYSVRDSRVTVEFVNVPENVRVNSKGVQNVTVNRHYSPAYAGVRMGAS